MVRLIILRLLESYFRHRWLYLLPVVLLVAIGAVYYLVIQEPVYIVRSVMYVQPDSLLSTLISVPDDRFAYSTPAETTATEIDELLQTDAYIRSLIQETDLEGNMTQSNARDLIAGTRDDVWVEALGRNQLLLAAAHENPNVAYQLSQAMADNFIQWRINADRKETEVAQEFFDNLTESYQAELEQARDELEAYLEAHPEPLVGERAATEMLQISRLQSEIELARSRYGSVLDKEENADLAMAQTESSVRQTYFLIDAPRLPTEPVVSLRGTVMNIALFGLVGVVLALVGIVGGAVIDRGVRFPLDVENQVGIPVLAMVPESPPNLPSEDESAVEDADAQPGKAAWAEQLGNA